MSFTPGTYDNLLSEQSAAQTKLFPQYQGARSDVVVIGSGMGGGVLADDLADRAGTRQRILVLEAGSYVFPSHVYNFCRFPMRKWPTSMSAKPSGKPVKPRIPTTCTNDPS